MHLHQKIGDKPGVGILREEGRVKATLASVRPFLNNPKQDIARA